MDKDIDILHDVLLEKLQSEQNIWIKDLKSEGIDAVLEHAYEYVIREDIIFSLMEYREEINLGKEEMERLISIKDTLSGIYYTHQYLEDESYMVMIKNSIINEANDLEHFELMPKYPDPDPTITQMDMFRYGYKWSGMLPLNMKQAEKLYKDDLQIFCLYPDNTEGIISEDIKTLQDHAENGGIFGIEKTDWEALCEYNAIKQRPPEIEPKDAPAASDRPKQKEPEKDR